MTDKEIDISDVPLTPGGENRDFKAVLKYEFVRFSELVMFRTTTLCNSENNESPISDNEVDLNQFKTDDEKVDAIIKSSMVEVRKKSKTSQSFTKDGEIRLNPNRNDLMETSAGCYNNYTKGRRNTISVVEINSPKNKKNRPGRNSVPGTFNVQDNKENVSLNRELDLLVSAVDDSRTLLEAEWKRLSDLISDWNHILEIEDKDISTEIQGDIKSTIGGLQMLMDNRYQSTIELLQLAEIYIHNDGVKLNENDQEYRAGDIYGFVDILIDEIKKIDAEFKKLLDIRNNNWNKVDLSEPEEVKSIKQVKKTVPAHLKNVKSRLNIASIRRQKSRLLAQQQEAEKSMTSKSDPLDIETNSTEKPNEKMTLVPSFKSGVRLKSSIKTLTGTPVHNDTPRPPRKSIRKSKDHTFAIPTAKVSVPKNRKRSFAAASISEDNQSPVSNFKMARTRKSGRKSKD